MEWTKRNFDFQAGREFPGEGLPAYKDVGCATRYHAQKIS